MQELATHQDFKTFLEQQFAISDIPELDPSIVDNVIYRLADTLYENLKQKSIVLFPHHTYKPPSFFIEPKDHCFGWYCLSGRLNNFVDSGISSNTRVSLDTGTTVDIRRSMEVCINDRKYFLPPCIRYFRTNIKSLILTRKVKLQEYS